jgi:hypothetical protein
MHMLLMACMSHGVEWGRQLRPDTTSEGRCCMRCHLFWGTLIHVGCCETSDQAYGCLQALSHSTAAAWLQNCSRSAPMLLPGARLTRLGFTCLNFDRSILLIQAPILSDQPVHERGWGMRPRPGSAELSSNACCRFVLTGTVAISSSSPLQGLNEQCLRGQLQTRGGCCSTT